MQIDIEKFNDLKTRLAQFLEDVHKDVSIVCVIVHNADNVKELLFGPLFKSDYLVVFCTRAKNDLFEFSLVVREVERDNFKPLIGENVTIRLTKNFNTISGILKHAQKLQDGKQKMLLLRDSQPHPDVVDNMLKQIDENTNLEVLDMDEYIKSCIQANNQKLKRDLTMPELTQKKVKPVSAQQQPSPSSQSSTTSSTQEQATHAVIFKPTTSTPRKTKNNSTA